MATGNVILATLVVLLGASGSYLLLPHRHGATKPRTLHAIGALLSGLGLLGFLSFWSAPGPFLSGLFFYVFAIAAVIGGLLTVTSRDPVHCALWFASVVLSTAGLFLLAGAQFLAAGTIIVYAGAIIVTFLFVIMLAQMDGKADYDRAARAPGRATFTCFLLFWCLLYSLGSLRAVSPHYDDPALDQMASEKDLMRAPSLLPFHRISGNKPVAQVIQHAYRPTSSIRDSQKLEKPNVAGLGEALYTDHLLTVELAGVLLFVALIAAVLITNPKRPVRPGEAVPIPDVKS